MKSKLAYELWKWFYFVILFFIGTFLIVVIGELIALPLLRWFLYDIPYVLPDWEHVKRWGMGIAFIGFFAGTASWHYEKRISER